MEHPVTANYRSKDPVQNLAVEVTVTQLGVGRAVHGAEEEAGTSAAEGAEGTEPSSSAPAPAAGRQQQQQQQQQREKSFKQTFVATWQQKVFSAREVERLSALVDPENVLDKKYVQMVKEGAKPGVIFTRVNGDVLREETPAGWAVTTSEAEASHPLVKGTAGKKLVSARKFQHMCIMFDCDAAMGGSNKSSGGGGGEQQQEEEVNDEVTLVSFKASADGSLQVKPGFCGSEEVYRFSRPSGAVFEYSVRNVSDPAPSELEKRKGALAKTAGERAAAFRRTALGSDYMPLPGPSQDAMRLTLLMEIMAGRGFDEDNLYVEYVVDYDKDLWTVNLEGQKHVRGVTQVARATTYPGSGHGDDEGFWSTTNRVAHFAFPVELEFTAQEPPDVKDFPTIYFQVSSHDGWDRYRVQGLCYLHLGSEQPGSRTHRMQTWRPLGSITDRLNRFYIGGSPELEDITFLRFPQEAAAGAATKPGEKPPPLDKSALSTQSSGELKVRTHLMLQTAEPEDSPQTRLHGVADAVRQSLITRRMPTKQAMADIVERARLRLAEAKTKATKPRSALLSRTDPEP